MNNKRVLNLIILVSLVLVSNTGIAQGSPVSVSIPSVSSVSDGSVVEKVSTPGRLGDDITVLPADVPPDWWATVQGDIRQSEYHITWQDQTYLPDLPAAYQAPNRAHNLRTYFTPTGIHVIPRSNTAPAWRWGLRLTGYGYAGSVQPVATAEMAASTNRIEYRRRTLTEWYVNDERGVEQGFTLNSLPAPLSSRPLVLDLALTGDLVPDLTEDGTAIEFNTPDGTYSLRYGSLRAYDITGRQLPTHLELLSSSGKRESRVQLVIDGITAVYPITVDLLVTSLSDWWVGSGQTDSYFGGSVGTAGDVNGDGFDDIIVGAPLYDNGQLSEGRVFVWFGGVYGLGTSGRAADWWAESDQSSAQLGFSVGTAGDVNGDGKDDIIVGAHQYISGTSQGRVFVWYGALGTSNRAPDWWAQASSFDHFGWSVGTAGDVNGDGKDDIIVGAPYYSNGQSGEGGAFVWYGGSTNGLGTSNRTYDWHAESDQERSGEDIPNFGCSVGTAGDVNGDGKDDIIVGASDYDRKGRVFVWYGSANGLGTDGRDADWSAESAQASAAFGFSVGTAGNVNGDPWDDIIVGAPYHTSGQAVKGGAFMWYGGSSGLGAANRPADWQSESSWAHALFGFSVGTAGDLDGDGYSDIIVGAPQFQNVGAAFIWYGSSSGPDPNQPQLHSPLQYASNHGESVGTAGDVNGDGADEIIVGAPLRDGTQPNEGYAYVSYGETIPNWAFLLYLDGDNGLSSLLQPVVHNLEAIATNPNLILLVLHDGATNGDTWRYHVQPGGNYTDGVNRWPMGEQDMSNPQTLSDFITWARDNYPAKHYYLAVDNHGRGTSGIAWDDTTGPGQLITVAELGQAIENATLSGEKPLDVVHYNACLMGMLEDAYQIQDYADYLVVSENWMWTIDPDYVPWAALVTSITTPEQLAIAVADKYHTRCMNPHTISALDLGQVGAVEDAVTTLATAMQATLGANKYYVNSTRDATQKFDSRHYCVIENNDEYLDLYNFAQLIKQNHPDVNVKNAAQGVMDAVNNLVIAEGHQSGNVFKCVDEYGVTHSNIYWDLDDAHGVSIYFPPARGVSDYDDYISHVLFSFTADGKWDEFLQSYFGAMGLPPETPVDPGPPPRSRGTSSVYLPIVIKQAIGSS